MPASIRAWARESYSSAEPSHQWTASGWVRSAISPTQSRSFACVVGAAAAMVWLIRGTLFIGRTEVDHTCVRIFGCESSIVATCSAPFSGLTVQSKVVPFSTSDSGRAIDRGDLFSNRVGEARFQLVLHLGAVEHRFSAAGGKQGSGDQPKHDAHGPQQARLLPVGNTWRSIPGGPGTPSGSTFSVGREGPSEVGVPKKYKPPEGVPGPPRRTWIGFRAADEVLRVRGAEDCGAGRNPGH